MFYCDECRRKYKWPESIIMKSRGLCEMCHRPALCNDVPSSRLPDTKPQDKKDNG